MRKLIGTFPLVVLYVCGVMQSHAATCNAVTNNLVSNCGFESGNFGPWTGTATTNRIELRRRGQSRSIHHRVDTILRHL